MLIELVDWELQQVNSWLMVQESLMNFYFL